MPVRDANGIVQLMYQTGGNGSVVKAFRLEVHEFKS